MTTRKYLCLILDRFTKQELMEVVVTVDPVSPNADWWHEEEWVAKGKASEAWEKETRYGSLKHLKDKYRRVTQQEVYAARYRANDPALEELSSMYVDCVELDQE